MHNIIFMSHVSIWHIGYFTQKIHNQVWSIPYGSIVVALKSDSKKGWNLKKNIAIFFGIKHKSYAPSFNLVGVSVGDFEPKITSWSDLDRGL